MIQYKTNRIRDEWKSDKIPQALRNAVELYAELREVVIGQDTTLTSLYRSEQENRAAGAKSRTHIEWRACDCRIDMEKFELEDLVRQVMNKKMSTNIKPMPRIPPLRHGTEPHGHVQITKAEAPA